MRSNNTTRVIVPISPWLGPAFSTSTAASSFAAAAPTLTKPSTNDGNGVAILPGDNAKVRACFYGEGADNSTFDVKVIGWSRVWADGAAVDPPANPDKTVEWIPTAIAFLTVTLGTTTGVAAGVVGGTANRFADTIAQAAGGYGAGDLRVVSPGDNLPGYIEVPTSGFQMIGLYFDLTGATAANALYANI